MISERTLRRWRQDALISIEHPMYVSTGDSQVSLVGVIKERDERILRLTQELMDQHLMTKGR